MMLLLAKAVLDVSSMCNLNWRTIGSLLSAAVSGAVHSAWPVKSSLQAPALEQNTPRLSVTGSPVLKLGESHCSPGK